MRAQVLRLLKVSLFLFLILFSGQFIAQVKLCSWNIKDLGVSKSDSELDTIANIVKDFDIVAIQEVVAGYGGAQAIAKLSDKLNRKGAQWDYVISNPTKSSPYRTERYAYLWKPGRIKRISKPWLESEYESCIDREPYFSKFSYKGKIFTILNFHAIPKSKQPETEIKYFKFFPGLYPNNNLIFAGDFNCPQSHTVFNPLKSMGYKPVLQSQKTSLKLSCDKSCLSEEYDNIFYNITSIEVIKYGVIHFYKKYEDLKAARYISDHIPVWMEFDVF